MTTVSLRCCLSSLNSPNAMKEKTPLIVPVVVGILLLAVILFLLPTPSSEASAG